MGVTIRSLADGDLDEYERLFTPLVQTALHVSSAATERIYIQERIAHHANGTTFLFGILLDDALIGALEIRDASTSRGQLYCWLNESFWGNGYFQKALALAASCYFNHTHDLYITAHVDCDNIRSYRALKKVGFADAGFIHGPHGKQFELLLRRKT